MDWFIDNWPMLLVVLAAGFIITGLMRKLLKIAFIGVAIGAVGLVLWPLVASGG